ncbi:MAG: hypothetical protein KAH77_02520 [Thiomargarita sp.]|nr:hypothetical protein [Thiomargarita sp.]
MTTQSQYIEIIKKIIKHEQTARRTCFTIKYFKMFRNLQKRDITDDEVFSFLSLCLKKNITVAMHQESGFKEAIIPQVNAEKDYIAFIIQFQKYENRRKHVLTYSFKLACHHGKVFIIKEFLKYRWGSKGKPHFFLDYSKKRGHTGINKTDSTRQVVWAEDCLALKALGQDDKRYPVINFIHTLLETWLEDQLKQLELSHAH